MKRILLSLLLPIVLVNGAVGQQPVGISPTLMRYTVKGDGFSVVLDARPTMTTTKVRSKDGKERTKRFLTTTVNSVVYSIDVVENLKPGQPLEEFIAESNASLQTNRATKRNLTVDGFPGTEYSSQTDTTTTVTQFFATEDRLFRFAATGPPTAAPVIKNFFSSIRLGPNTDGIDVAGRYFRPDTGEQVFTGKDVDVKARLISKTEPTYTKDARDNGVEGVVIIRAVFSKNGQVEYLRVVQGLPYGLTEQALKAAREIKFVPAMKDGKAVSMWIQLEYNFTL